LAERMSEPQMITDDLMDYDRGFNIVFKNKRLSKDSISQ
jgi:hypothetical protein